MGGRRRRGPCARTTCARLNDANPLAFHALLLGLLQTASASSFSDPLPEAAIREYLEGLLTTNVNGSASAHEFAVVMGYTFVTFPMTTDNVTRSTRSSGISTVRTRRVVIYVRARVTGGKSRAPGRP